jgi:hypothetical protein
MARLTEIHRQQQPSVEPGRMRPHPPPRQTPTKKGRQSDLGAGNDHQWPVPRVTPGWATWGRTSRGASWRPAPWGGWRGSSRHPEEEPRNCCGGTGPYPPTGPPETRQPGQGQAHRVRDEPPTGPKDGHSPRSGGPACRSGSTSPEGGNAHWHGRWQSSWIAAHQIRRDLTSCRWWPSRRRRPQRTWGSVLALHLPPILHLHRRSRPPCVHHEPLRWWRRRGWRVTTDRGWRPTTGALRPSLPQHLAGSNRGDLSRPPRSRPPPHCAAWVEAVYGRPSKRWVATGKRPVDARAAVGAEGTTRHTTTTAAWPASASPTWRWGRRRKVVHLLHHLGRPPGRP